MTHTDGLQAGAGGWELVGKSREAFRIDFDPGRDLAASFRTPNLEDAHRLSPYSLERALRATAQLLVGPSLRSAQFLLWRRPLRLPRKECGSPQALWPDVPNVWRGQ